MILMKSFVSGRRFRSQFCGTFSINADEFALAALILELNNAFDQSEQRVILAASDILAGLPFRSPLAGKDIATKHVLTTEFFKSEPLRVRIAAVS